MTICKECKYARWPLIFNGFPFTYSEWVCIQKDWEEDKASTEFHTNPTNGNTIYTKCACKNDGNCRWFEKGKWKLMWSVETTNALV